MKSQLLTTINTSPDREKLGTLGDPAIGYRVGYADTDAGGIVYHGRYVEMCERSRNSLMYSADISFASLAEQFQVMFVIQKMEATYHAPAVLEDFLSLKTQLTACRPAYTTWITNVTREDDLLATLTTRVVAIHTVTRQLTRFSETLLARLSRIRDE